jgi:hypothetical protein
LPHDEFDNEVILMSNSPATAVLEKDPACLPAQICSTQIPVPLKKPEFTAKDNIIFWCLLIAYSGGTGWYAFSAMEIAFGVLRSPSQMETMASVSLIGTALTFLIWSFHCFRLSGRNLMKGAVGACVGRLFLALLLLLIGTGVEWLGLAAYASAIGAHYDSFVFTGCS